MKMAKMKIEIMARRQQHHGSENSSKRSNNARHGGNNGEKSKKIEGEMRRRKWRIGIIIKAASAKYDENHKQ